MKTIYCSSNKHAAVAQWAANTVYAAGALRRQLATPAQGNERVFRCTTPGTSGAAEPAWILTAQSTTSDGTAVWTECTGESWNAPHASIDAALDSAITEFDTIYVGHLHNYTWAASKTIRPAYPSAFRFIPVISVDETTGLYRKGAEENTSGTAKFYFKDLAKYFGITFRVGTAGQLMTTDAFYFNAGGTYPILSEFNDCTLELRATPNGVSFLKIGNVNDSYYAWNAKVNFKKCEFIIPPNMDFLTVCRAHVRFEECTIGRTQITCDGYLVDSYGYGYSRVEFLGCDLTNFNNTQLVDLDSHAAVDVVVDSCSKPVNGFSTYTPETYDAYETTNPLGFSGSTIEVLGMWNERYKSFTSCEGHTRNTETVYVSGGSSKNGVPYSLLTRAFGIVSDESPLKVALEPVDNQQTGVAKTLTVEIAQDNGATALTESEIKLCVAYFGDANSPKLTFADDGNSTPITRSQTVQAASSATWVNLTNPTKQKLEVTITPQKPGEIIAWVEISKKKFDVYINGRPAIS